ncbi:MAG: hypothetical protein KAS38_20860 [Anaerolineales bacterium]|nr:hypothetical protein [Anaerolineales bacterium]
MADDGDRFWPSYLVDWGEKQAQKPWPVLIDSGPGGQTMLLELKMDI